MRATDESVVSIIACFYNEELAVDAFFRELLPIVDGLTGVCFEIICVDDGSQDNTLTKLLTYAAQDPRIITLELSRNFGKEAALTAGLDEAQGDAAIPIDVDLQDPPDLIPIMIERWRNGAEVVLARRSNRSSDSFLKRKTATLFYRLHNRLSLVHLPENVGDFRLIDRIVIESLRQLPERQRFMKGLFAWVGFRTVIVDYVRLPRRIGKSKFSGWKLWNLAIEGITSFTTLPLRVWTYIGMLGALASLTYATFILGRTILHGVDVPGYASLLIVVLFMGSVQLVSIGLLGEYIGRIYGESKHRPVYLVRKRHGGNRNRI